MEIFRTPQRMVPVRVLLEDGQKLEGGFYVPATGPDGNPGRLLDRLNDASEEFLPLAGRYETLLNKACIVTVEPQPPKKLASIPVNAIRFKLFNLACPAMSRPLIPISERHHAAEFHNPWRKAQHLTVVWRAAQINTIMDLSRHPLERWLLHQRHLFAQGQNVLVPIALSRKPGEGDLECGVAPAPRQPSGIMHDPQAAQRLDEVQFARVEVAEFFVTRQQCRELRRLLFLVA